MQVAAVSTPLPPVNGPTAAMMMTVAADWVVPALTVSDWVVATLTPGHAPASDGPWHSLGARPRSHLCGEATPARGPSPCLVRRGLAGGGDGGVSGWKGCGVVETTSHGSPPPALKL